MFILYVQIRKIVVVAYWASWYTRNMMVHERLRPNTHEIVVIIKGFLLEIETLEELKPATFLSKQEVWVPLITSRKSVMSENVFLRIHFYKSNL